MSKYSPEYLTEMKREPMNLNFIRQAINDNAILEAKVVKCDSNCRLTVALGKNITGTIDFDELEYTEDGTIKSVSATTKVNKHIKFKPLEIIKEDDGYRVICSRKAAQKDCMENYIKKLLPGDVIDARAVRIMNYGVFCDIGCGIVALLPTNNISVTHIVNTCDLLKGLTRLKVVVKDIENPFKIQLSHKELLGTWEQEVSKFNEGDIIKGMVLSVEDYGVFIRISQNLSGLAEPTEINIKSDDLVSVQILNIKPDNMKVRLNITERIDFDDEVTAAEEKKLKFDYYEHPSNISRWVYSTETAKKQIISEFR